MNSLDLNLLNIEYNIDNRVETDPNNEFWYSSTYLPLSQQLLESTIHKWRLDSNQSIIRPQLKHESNKGLKRSYNSINESEDYERRKRSRNQESYHSESGIRNQNRNWNRNNRELRTNYKDLSGSQLSLECKSCHSLSYSFLDFKQHLKGRRHASNMRSKRFSASPVRHSLQINLDKTSEPVVGLDFIQESDEWSNETLFECKLCVCCNLKHSSALQHILGFRHRFNYIKFIDSREAKAFMDSEMARSLAKKFELLYGRGNCKFIKNREHKTFPTKEYHRRHSSRTSSRRSPESRVIDSECATNSSSRKVSKTGLIEKNINSLEKTIETLKAIRELCDKTLNLYEHSVKQKDIKEENSLHSGLVSTHKDSDLNFVTNTQTVAKELSNIDEKQSNGSKELV